MIGKESGWLLQLGTSEKASPKRWHLNQHFQMTRSGISKEQEEHSRQISVKALRQEEAWYVTETEKARVS